MLINLNSFQNEPTELWLRHISFLQKSKRFDHRKKFSRFFPQVEFSERKILKNFWTRRWRRQSNFAGDSSTFFSFAPTGRHTTRETLHQRFCLNQSSKGFSSVRWFYSFFSPLGINWDKSRTNHQCICFPANIFVFRFTSKGEESKRESKWSFSSVFIRSDFIVMTFCSAFLTIFFRRCYEKSTSSSNRTVCVRISMSSAVWLDRLLWNRWISQKAMVCP